ncbi:MAG TPA: hypothetical protein VGP93_03015, partial [Polyangiaceae bacterium]|nr:hypothetical protein [Polyangiaceae bacterium]
VVTAFAVGLIPMGGASAQRQIQKPERVSTPTLPAPSAAARPASSLRAESALSPSARPSSKALQAGPSASPSATPPPAAVSASAAPSPPPETPEVNLSALSKTQGYLFVRSTTKARVFILANDSGETNQPILTTCGTRFVRLGRKLGDFIEPGGPVIIKCGALTEVRREKH